MSKSDKKF